MNELLGNLQSVGLHNLAREVGALGTAFAEDQSNVALQQSLAVAKTAAGAMGAFYALILGDESAEALHEIAASALQENCNLLTNSRRPDASRAEKCIAMCISRLIEIRNDRLENDNGLSALAGDLLDGLDTVSSALSHGNWLDKALHNLVERISWELTHSQHSQLELAKAS